jgi:hypothetical protein
MVNSGAPLRRSSVNETTTFCRSEFIATDLARLPENGWSLFELAESLRKQKKNADEVAQTQAKFEKVWAKADLTISTSCLCQPQA